MISLSNNNTAPSSGVINLTKGAKINLSKQKPALKKFMIGLGWNCQKYSGQDDFDLDASVFLVNKYGKTNQNGFIFYNNLVGPNGCVQHQGDNRVGGTGGDDEQIYVDLELIPEDVEKICVTVTIDRANERGQTFGLVENAYCRLVNTETDEEEVRVDLGEDFSVETALVVIEVYRHNGEWKLNAVGRGFDNGLLGLCRNYGLDAEYR